MRYLLLVQPPLLAEGRPELANTAHRETPPFTARAEHSSNGLLVTSAAITSSEDDGGFPAILTRGNDLLGLEAD